jgi:hypothetical protein
LLAVVSRNYIQGQFCTTELQAFSQRFEQMERDARAGRIFRADKQAVDENLLPRPLQDLQAVRFYDNDPKRASSSITIVAASHKGMRIGRRSGIWRARSTSA